MEIKTKEEFLKELGEAYDLLIASGEAKGFVVEGIAIELKVKSSDDKDSGFVQNVRGFSQMELLGVLRTRVTGIEQDHLDARMRRRMESMFMRAADENISETIQ